MSQGIFLHLGSNGFVSMDLIGDFTPSSKGNKYALTVMMLTITFPYLLRKPQMLSQLILIMYMEALKRFSQIMVQNLKTNYLKR